jgi:predicted RNase H-like HicB family nuclease
VKHQYKAEIRWSDEDQVFVARAPELDGVVTDGKTLIEAAKHLEEAIELHLESLRGPNKGKSRG